jgi:SAM-dependent methyltransferase
MNELLAGRLMEEWANQSAPRSKERMKTILHVGSGAGRLPAGMFQPPYREIRVDIDPAVVPDVVASITSMPTVQSLSIDIVYANHVLEHVHAHEVPLALAEFLRVLKPGGRACISVPNLEELFIQLTADGRPVGLEDTLYIAPAGPICGLDVLYGWGKAIAAGHVGMQHKTGFTAATLVRKLERAGFIKVETESVDLNLHAQAWKSTWRSMDNAREQFSCTCMIVGGCIRHGTKPIPAWYMEKSNKKADDCG